jgi:hypothetical protein
MKKSILLFGCLPQQALLIIYDKQKQTISKRQIFLQSETILEKIIQLKATCRPF